MMFTKTSIYVILGITVLSSFSGLYLLYTNATSQLVSFKKEISVLERTVADQNEIIQMIKRQTTIITEEQNNLSNELDSLSRENSKLRSELKKQVSQMLNSDNTNREKEIELNDTVNDLFKGIGK